MIIWIKEINQWAWLIREGIQLVPENCSENDDES